MTVVLSVRYRTQSGTLHCTRPRHGWSGCAKFFMASTDFLGPASCHVCALRCQPAFRPHSARELRFIGGMKKQHLAFAAGEPLIAEGQNSRVLYTLYEGWALRFRMLANGTRQVLDFLLPGDLIGLPATFPGGSRASIVALTPITVCVLDGAVIANLVRGHPEYADALLRDQALERERADTRLTLLGRTGASERIGYLLLELRDRLRMRGLFPGRSVMLPVQRSDLADSVGLSRVHVTRAMRELRERNLADLSDRVLTIPNAQNLARHSGYPLGKPLAVQTLL